MAERTWSTVMQDKPGPGVKPCRRFGTGSRRAVAVSLLAALIVALASAPAQATVSKSQREAVVIVADLSAGLTGLEKTFYQGIEKAAYLGAVTILSPVYNHVAALEGTGATLAGMRNALSAATSHTGTKAVDLFFVTHGLDHNVVMADGRKSMTTVRNDLINHLTTAQRAKLRIVFSTACFGASHRADWVASGFDAASGSQGVYSDSASSYVPFLGAWALGASFGSAITAANLADAFHVWDALANNTVLKGTPFEGQANSTRSVLGDDGLTIDGNPVGRFQTSPTNANTRAGREVTYSLSWTVPKPRKVQSLHTVGLRLHEFVAAKHGTRLKGLGIAVRWFQETNTLQLVDANDRLHGIGAAPKQPGTLSGTQAALDLARTRVSVSGRTVKLTLPLRLAASASRRNFRVEVAASDDGGKKAPWQVAGLLTVG
jgi:hypothetical protein